MCRGLLAGGQALTPCNRKKQSNKEMPCQKTVCICMGVCTGRGPLPRLHKSAVLGELGGDAAWVLGSVSCQGAWHAVLSAGWACHIMEAITDVQDLSSGVGEQNCKTEIVSWCLQSSAQLLPVWSGPDTICCAMFLPLTGCDGCTGLAGSLPCLVVGRGEAPLNPTLAGGTCDPGCSWCQCVCSLWTQA